MKIIIGLGNIGPEYLKTRHNIGFMALDRLVKGIEEEGAEISWKEDKKLKAVITKMVYNGETVLVAKPTTLMNRSGEAAVNLLNFYKLQPEDLIVIQDDIDLNIGEVRFRESGSAGTHNGMKSIITLLGTTNFRRIKIGIESRGDLSPNIENLAAFVLSKFNEKEMEIIDESLNETTEMLKNLTK